MPVGQYQGEQEALVTSKMEMVVIGEAAEPRRKEGRNEQKEHCRVFQPVVQKPLRLLSTDL